MSPGAIVADVGAGPGYVTALLARRVSTPVRQWLVLEPQREMWSLRGSRRALRSSAGFRPVRLTADGSDLPLRGGSVDVVLSIGVLCCMPEARVPGAVAEMHRVLRPGGLLWFRVPRPRGPVDEARFRGLGFVEVARERPGAVLFRKAD